MDLKSMQYGFESHVAHHSPLAQLAEHENLYLGSIPRRVANFMSYVAYCLEHSTTGGCPEFSLALRTPSPILLN